MLNRSPKRPGAAPQRGAAAIEFAFLFVIFFGVFYAILSYVFVVLLQQGLAQASAEGARAAIRIDPANYTSVATFRADATTVAKNAVNSAIAWMPAAWEAALKANTQVTFNQNSQTLASGAVVTSQTVTVTLTYANYASNPMLPTLSLPNLGTIPTVPQNLVGKSTATF